jgi:glycosyltransferase involved in cell wall biosynthesis
MTHREAQLRRDLERANDHRGPIHQRKIVVTVPWGERLGGAEHMLWTFLRRVDRAALEPIVVFLAEGRFEREVAALGIRTLVLPARRLRHAWRTVSTIRALAAFLRRERPDLLVNWTAKAQLYGAPAALIAGMGHRVVWWQHGIPTSHWMDRIATLLPARAVGCSSRASAAAQELQRPRRRTFVVHPGVETSPPVDGEEAQRMRGDLGLSGEDLIIGIVGRLQPWKGQDRLIRAVSVLRKRGLRVHGLVVGGDAHGRSPEYEPRLRRLVAELGLADDVTFTGHVSDATDYIRTMDVLVNASDHEPFGIVLLEAMALGTPVVAVADGGPSEVIDHGESGILLASNGADEIADAVEALLARPSLRTRLAHRALERFTSEFSATSMTDRLAHKLEELCEESR